MASLPRFPLTSGVQNPPTRVGAYQIVRELGRGGMGVVYEVRHPQVPRPLALKLAFAHLCDAEGVARFQREGEIMARVRHPNLVSVHTLDRCSLGPYLVTDLVEGDSLKVVLAKGGPLAPDRAARIVRDLADAVQALHDGQALHRDLKPENVILRPDGSPCLLDFGVARDQRGQSLTQTGEMVGTPGFMSPEQVDGAKTAYGPWTDVYGLGGVLYALLTDRFPAAGDSLVSILKAILEDDPPWPSTLRDDMPAALEVIVKRALAKTPARRIQSAAELSDALSAFLTGDARSRLAAPAIAIMVALSVVLVLAVGALSAPGLADSPSPLIPAEGPAREPADGTPPPVAVRGPISGEAANDVLTLGQGLARAHGFRRILTARKTNRSKALRDAADTLRRTALAVIPAVSLSASRAFFVNDTEIVVQSPSGLQLFDLSVARERPTLTRSWTLSGGVVLTMASPDRDIRAGTVDWSLRSVVCVANDRRIYRALFGTPQGPIPVKAEPLLAVSKPIVPEPSRTLSNGRKLGNRVTCLGVSPAGDTVVVASDWSDRHPHVIGLHGDSVRRLPAHPNLVYYAAFTPSGEVITTHDSWVLKRPLGLEDVSRRWPPAGTTITTIVSLAVARDGKTFAVGDHFGWVSVHTVDGTRSIHMKEAYPTRVSGLVFSPDGRTLYGTAIPNGVEVEEREGLNLHRAWRVESGGELLLSVSHGARTIIQLDLSPDGAWMALGMADGTVEIWGAGF